MIWMIFAVARLRGPSIAAAIKAYDINYNINYNIDSNKLDYTVDYNKPSPRSWDTPNLPTWITPAKIAWLKLSGKFPMGSLVFYVFLLDFTVEIWIRRSRPSPRSTTTSSRSSTTAEPGTRHLRCCYIETLL